MSTAVTDSCDSTWGEPVLLSALGFASYPIYFSIWGQDGRVPQTPKPVWVEGVPAEHSPHIPYLDTSVNKQRCPGDTFKTAGKLVKACPLQPGG